MKRLKSLCAMAAMAISGLLAPEHVRAGTPVPIDDYLRTLQSLTYANNAYDTYWPRTPIFLILPGLNSQSASLACRFEGRQFLRALCREANSQCNAATGDLGCWLPSLQRFRSTALRYEAAQYARNVFESLRTSQSIHDQCCDSSAHPDQCRQSFQNIRFSIITDVPFNDETCEFKYRTGTMQISEGMLMGCRDGACISSSIIHELGHACAYARLGSPVDQGIYLSGIREENFCRGTQHAVEQMLKMYREVFGDQITTCVVNGIKSRPGGCFATRLQEAFADGVFMSERTQISQLAWDCNEREDETHAKPISYEYCFLNMPQVRNHFCH